MLSGLSGAFKRQTSGEDANKGADADAGDENGDADPELEAPAAEDEDAAEEGEEEEEEAAAKRIADREKAVEMARKRKEEQTKRKLSKSTFDTVSWPFPEKFKNKNTVRLDELVALGIPRKELTSYLSQELRESESCRSMPFAFFLIIFYALSAMGHENASVVSDVQKSIEHNLRYHTNFGYVGTMGHQTLDDVRSFTDFWSWMHKGFIPNVFMQEEADTWNTTKPLAEDDPRRGMFLRYNRIMGGVRILLKQSEAPDGCATDRSLQRAWLLRCVGGLGYEMDPEKFDVFHFGEPTETEWLYTHLDIETLQNQVKDLEFGRWLDNTTSRIEVGIPMYNGEHGLYVWTKVSFFFSRSGNVWKDVSSESVFADWWPTASYMAVDAIFCLCILYIVSKEILEVRHMLMEHGHLKCLKLYINFWNCVDWFSVLAGLTVMSLFRKNHLYTVDLNTAATDLGNANALDMEQAELGVLASAALLALEEELEYAHSFRYAMAVYPLVIIMRVFKAFSAQARLAVVTDTIKYASVDLIHFMIVYLSVFGAYVISGVALFGRDVAAFVTPARAFNQLMRALLGDLEWEELRQAGRYEAMTFYFVFRLMMSQIMFNLLISIIMDAYQQVKSQADGAEMIWEELGQELVMRFGRNSMVPYWKVVAALQYDASVDTLVKEELKPKNPRTSYVQAHAASGTVTFTCFLQYPAMQQLGVETSKAIGAIVVCDGRGKCHQIVEGSSKSFPITLDEHKKFHWYHDSNSKGGAEAKFDLLQAVQEAEEGKSASGLVTIDYLMRALDSMSEEQANGIVQDAVEDFYATHHNIPGPEELRNLVMHLDHRSSKCLRAVMGEPKRVKTNIVSKAGRGASADPAPVVVQKKARGTVGHQLAKIFSLTETATLECTKILAKLDPDLTKVHEMEEGTTQAATFKELHLGDNVKILNDMRRIISACFDAGLSPENSQWRKEAAGCHGNIVEVDPFDKTVCVYIASIGKLWFAAGCIESADGQEQWGPPRIDELTRREREKVDAAERAKWLKDEREVALNDKFELERTKGRLELEIAEVLPTSEEATATCEEMRRRVEKQLKAKARCERAIEVLHKKQARLMQDGRAQSAVVRQVQETLHSLEETRNEYFDTMREMVRENQILRAKLEIEEETLTELQAVASADARSVKEYEHDIHHTISELTAERVKACREDEVELSWYAGQADKLSRKLKQDGRAPGLIQHLVELRNLTLDVGSSLQDLGVHE